MGVSQKYGTILGVSIVRAIVFGGLYWGPLILGNYQFQGLKNHRSWTTSVWEREDESWRHNDGEDADDAKLVYHGFPRDGLTF